MNDDFLKIKKVFKIVNILMCINFVKKNFLKSDFLYKYSYEYEIVNR